MVQLELPVPLALAPSWQVGVGASARNLDTVIELLSLDFTVNDVDPARPLPVRLSISLNGQQTSPAGQLTVLFAAAPRVSLIEPTTGPLAGDTLLTVHGAGLAGADRYQCHFGADLYVEATASSGRLACRAPKAAQRALLAFEVSLNGLSPTSSDVTFYYHDETVISSITPDSGLVASGNLCRLQGAGLFGGDRPTCM